MTEEETKRPYGITFSKEISLGHIVMFVGIMGSAVSVYTSLVARMGSQDNRVAALEKIATGQSEFNKSLIDILSEVKASVAVLKDRSERDGMAKK